MHKDFAEWYRLAGLEPNAEILPKRWGAIGSYVPGRDGVISLARLFYSLGKPDPDFLDKFIAAIQGSDPTFKTRGNENELSVLAGAKLIDVLEHPVSGLDSLAALSLVCAAGGNARPVPVVRDIPEIAARHLGWKSRNRILTSGDHADNAAREAMYEALTELGTPHDELVKDLRQLQRRLLIVTEESNMLWWLFSEYSRDKEQPWSKFSAQAAALMAGKELADLTLVIPGPIAALAFLDRVIKCAMSTTSSASFPIRDAINDVDIEWRQKYSEEYAPAELENLSPISYGIKLSLLSPENDSWLPAFAQQTGISSDSEMAPHILAYQIFIEALLCRCWKESN